MANGYLSVKNWDKFQQYKDGRPMLFIRVDVGLLDDYEFDQLTEVQQNHLMRIWLLAGRHHNKITNDPAWIAKKIGAKSKVDIKQLVACGFLIEYETVQDSTDQYEISLEKKREEKTIKEKKRVEMLQRAADFDVWYSKYPRKEKKKPAKEMWLTLDLPPVADMLSVLELQKQSTSWTDKDGKYIPLPTSYLNQERYNDEPIQPAAPVDEYAESRARGRAILSAIDDSVMGDDGEDVPPRLEEDQRRARV